MQANKLLEAKIEMLRANLQAARRSADGDSNDNEAELQLLRADLQKATRQVSELQETSQLFKEQQDSAVQAAVSLQKKVLLQFSSPLQGGHGTLCIKLSSTLFLDSFRKILSRTLPTVFTSNHRTQSTFKSNKVQTTVNSIQ